MNPGILVFTRDQNLLFELGHQLEDKHPIVPCESLDQLPEQLKTQPIGAVLVHLDRTTLNGYSPARFIAKGRSRLTVTAFTLSFRAESSSLNFFV